MLTQEDLEKTLMPIGEMSKGAVRAYAKKISLPTAAKKDSQGLCFLGDVDMKEFLRQFIKVKEGDVLNSKGVKIGTHDGALLYTLGQRTGFKINAASKSRPTYYVLAKDLPANTITVAGQSGILTAQATSEISIGNVNWIGARPRPATEYACEVRYHGSLQQCGITLGDSDTAAVHFQRPVLQVAPGQSIVVYSGLVCLGGGKVLE